MPTIRDGRGQLTVHDMVVTPGSPSGPVERLTGYGPATEQPAVIERRSTMAALAVSRARGASKGGFVKGDAKSDAKPLHHDVGPSAEPRPPKPTGVGSGQRGQRGVDRDAKAAQVLDALDRHQGDVDAAAGELGMRHNVVVNVAKFARLRAEAAAKPAHIVSSESPPDWPAIEAAAAAVAGADLPAPEPSVIASEYSAPDSTPQPAAPEPPDLISLNITIRVSATELATWRPERISRFFAGVAMVTAARWTPEP